MHLYIFWLCLGNQKQVVIVLINGIQRFIIKNQQSELVYTLIILTNSLNLEL